MSAARTGLSFLMLAAGAGNRLGMGPKGFLELAGRPLLCWPADKDWDVGEVCDQATSTRPPADAGFQSRCAAGDTGVAGEGPGEWGIDSCGRQESG